jgi:hypothetical protein
MERVLVVMAKSKEFVTLFFAFATVIGQDVMKKSKMYE